MHVLDRFAHLMGTRYPGLRSMRSVVLRVGDEPDSKQQDEYGPEAHRNLLL